MINKNILGKPIYVFAGVAVLILWKLLWPGYILTLDMVFAPEMEAIFSDNFFNSLPRRYLIHFLSILIPGWIIQKIILFFLFFCLGYLSFVFLPLPKNKTARLFSALFFTVNPFVYARFLAGHWFHLMAYALLPVFTHFLFKLTEAPNFKSALKLFLSIFLISLFSLHFFAMAAIVALVWFLYYSAKYLAAKKTVFLKLTIKNFVFGALLFLVAGSYWLIPALGRLELFSQKFDSRHWLAFAPVGHGQINVFWNVLSLNGFWGEGQPWAKQFAWPQDYAIFWIAFSFIALLIALGMVAGLKDKKIRSAMLFFSILGVAAFIFSTGAGETIFKNFNLWLYSHVFFWPGFRDSQKFSGLLALSYAVLAGVGADAVISFLNKKTSGWFNYFSPAILLAPIWLGFLIWGGFKNQLRPVWYPEVWHQTAKIIQTDEADYKVLFLPWHGYLSLNFNNNLLIANPARIFFGEKAIISKSVELEEIYDQETDPQYIKLDKVIRGEPSLAPDEAIDFFAKQNIKYIVYFQDLGAVDNLQYEFLTSARLRQVLVDKQLIMYEIKDD